MVKSIQARIPLSLFKEITRVQRQMEKESKERFGKKKPVTFVRAAQEFQRRRNRTFFDGDLI